MVDLNFINRARKLRGLVNVKKSVKAGEVYNQLTVLSDGSSTKFVAVQCSCGNKDKFPASSVSTGIVKRCTPCYDKMATHWVPPGKWKNPRPLDDRDKEILRKRIADREAKDARIAAARHRRT